MVSAARPVVLVAGIPLPLDELADALDQYATSRLQAERATRRGGPAFRSLPWQAAAQQLRVSATAQQPVPGVRRPRMLTCAEYGTVVGRSPVTARRWAANGQLPGAVQLAGRWLIPATATPPDDRRTHQ